MQPITTFAPGPSQMYFTVEGHLRKAFRDGIPSLSHRSKEFETLYIRVKEGLYTLLGLPGNYHVFFTSSATEIFERLLQNTVENKSFHLVNGAFSKKFHETAQQLGLNASQLEVEEGNSFPEIIVPQDAELIAMTQNETSTGVSQPQERVRELRKKNGSSLIAIDAVSALPYCDLDYSVADSVLFSVQKGFGMPAGLGVWMVNEQVLGRAEILAAKKTSLGSYHTIASLLQFEKKNQTPATPNVLGIYLLGKVIEDFLSRGIKQIRKETEYKAAILYQALDQHPMVKPFVKNNTDRSATVIVAECGSQTGRLTQFLKERGMEPGEGYGSFRSRQLRFANFPAHSREQYEKLVDAIHAFE